MRITTYKIKHLSDNFEKKIIQGAFLLFTQIFWKMYYSKYDEEVFKLRTVM